ncbi:MAG: hypothetical protein BZY81_03470 [SAR202 cluster bacterium Io17-Chloro-G4]|nr:MAG: hypothetical protein BZY81_03470 [SAR202 cluster bacterium Io17-Chloro-G4]
MENQSANEPFDYRYDDAEDVARSLIKGLSQSLDKSRIVYQIQESRSGKVFEAYCAELVITGFGDTAEAAKEELRSQVAMYLEDCDNLGELDDVLIEAGFYFDGDKWVSNEVAPVGDPKINFFGVPGESVPQNLPENS